MEARRELAAEQAKLRETEESLKNIRVYLAERERDCDARLNDMSDKV